MKRLKCAHCGERIPDDHGIYANPKGYLEALSKDRNVFCSKGHGTAWHHANRTPAEKKAYHDKIATTRRNRSPEQKAASAKKLADTYASFSANKRKRIADQVYETTQNSGGYAKAVERREKTLIDRHGEDYGKKRHQEFKKTMQERYGVDNPWCKGTSSRQKMVETLLEKYGVDSATKDPGIKKKLVDTYTKNNGGMGRASKSADAKFKETMQSLYGADNPSKIKAFVKKQVRTFKRVGAKKAMETRRQNGTLPSQVAWKGHETKKRNGTYRKNKAEQHVLNRLRSLLGPQVEHLYRKHPGYPWEADFYDPETGILYEYQGYFTHGGVRFDPKNKDHQVRAAALQAKSEETGKWAPKLTLHTWTKGDEDKRKAAEVFNIPFVEWFSMDQFNTWFDSQFAALLGSSYYKHGCYKIGKNIVVAYDSPLLQKALEHDPIIFYPWDDLRKIARLAATNNTRVYARDTESVLISKKLADRFCQKYHLQGSCVGTKTAIGLRLKNGKRLVAVMTFGKPRYNKNYTHELLRLCFSTHIVGGTSKMWATASKHLSGSAITYCDLSKFNGEVYAKLGFCRKKGAVRPSTHWYNPETGQRISDNLLRQRGFDQLVGRKLGELHGKGTSNTELMHAANFIPIQDLGQATFILESI